MYVTVLALLVAAATSLGYLAGVYHSVDGLRARFPHPLRAHATPRSSASAHASMPGPAAAAVAAATPQLVTHSAVSIAQRAFGTQEKPRVSHSLRAWI